MPEQQQQEKSWSQKQQEGFNLFSWAVAIHSICIYPFIRSGLGVRGIGAPGFFAMLLIPLYAGTMQSEEMLTYWWAWVFMVVWRRITADRYQLSTYPGWPWFAARMTFNYFSELTLRKIEPLLAFIVGGMLCAWSEPVGMFVAFGLVTMGIKTGLDSSLLAMQDLAAADAVREMEMRQQRIRRR